MTVSSDIDAAREAGEDIPPAQTPWGGAETFERIAEGIWHLSTPSHGGFWLASARRTPLIQELARTTTLKSAEWFEEDVDWAIPALVFADEMRANPTAGEPDPEDTLCRARAILSRFRPDALARIDAAGP